MKINSVRKALLNPRKIIDYLLRRNARIIHNDKLYLSLLWWCRMGYKLDWNNPQTFCEKIQWLKLYNRNPQYTKLVDKLAVKKYIADILGEEYVIPTLGVWDQPKDIDFDALPERFVLKTTHGGGGGGVVICKDKSLLDKNAVIDKLQRSMKSDIYLSLREWPYKDVPRRIIAEQYMEDHGVNTSSSLTDYKFFCFDGIPRYCQIIKDRNTKETIDFFDMEWNHQEFVGLNPVSPDFGHASVVPECPKNFELMKKMAMSLSKDIPFSRVDLYEIDERTYFGEITLFPASGIGRFEPECYDKLLGKMICLEGQKRGGVIFEVDGTSFKCRPAPAMDLHDIKIFCFNGKAEFFKIDFGRFVEHHANYYDTDMNLLPFGEADMLPIPDAPIRIPDTISKMLTMAEKLSVDIPFLRVDFYDVDGRIFFGELTFYPASGMGKFVPEEYDTVLGREIEL